MRPLAHSQFPYDGSALCSCTDVSEVFGIGFEYPKDASPICWGAKGSGATFCEGFVYRRVFCGEFNLSFHIPRKDICAKCRLFEDADSSEKEMLREEHEKHLQRKELARKEKAIDKEKAKVAHSPWHAVTMDLQSVLSTPCGNVSSLYYARKLSVYNFTIYDQASEDGYCMVRDETQWHRGSNEIGSLIYRYLNRSIPSHIQHVS